MSSVNASSSRAQQAAGGPESSGAAGAVGVLADPWLRRLLAGIITVLTGETVGVAGLAFVASFDAIHDYAARSAGITRAHAWMAPLFVDSFVFIGACADLWTALTRTPTSTRGWTARLAGLGPKALLVAAAAASYGLNIAHAPPTVPARVVAALPPTALVVSEIIVMLVIRQAAHLRLTHTPPTVRREGEGGDVKARAWRLLAAWDAAGIAVNGTQLAAELGTSPRHGRRLIADYRHTLPAAASGNGGRPERGAQS